MPFVRGLLAARRELRAARQRTTVESSNDLFNEVLCRSAADLSMLMTDTPQGRYPYAGIPWYSTTFGRDGLITALQMLWWNPRWRAACCAALPPTRRRRPTRSPTHNPGKILHEMRAGEMAALHEVPFGLYYGSVDATPLFVLLAGAYVERTGDEETLAELWPAIEAALGWIDGPGDPDRDGFVEYWRATEQGLANQGWKDSHDAIFHADGRLAEGPIALAEVQGYVFAAKRLAARCARRLGQMRVAGRLESEAARLAERFEAAFWCPEIETYALALDGAKQPCRVRTSNAGQVLFAGIASPERAAAVARGLMETGFNLRLGHSHRGQRRSPLQSDVLSQRLDLAARQFPDRARLCPLWIYAPVEQLFKGLFNAATYMDPRRLPELYCGFQRQRGRGPTLYPVACSPQAWASATPFTLLEASLGLEFDPGKGEIRLRNPRLPSFLDEVTLRNLRLGLIERRSQGAPPQGSGLARYPAHQRQYPGFRRLFVVILGEPQSCNPLPTSLPGN